MQTQDSGNYLLSFSHDEKGQLFVHADKAGLERLAENIKMLQKKLEKGESDHEHLMTKAWGGSDLTENQGMKDVIPLHHVKLYGWTAKDAQKLGLM